MNVLVSLFLVLFSSVVFSAPVDITITWDYADNTATGAKVLRRDVDPTWLLQGTVNVPVNSLDLTVEEGPQCFQVIAFNSNGDSAPAEICAQILPGLVNLDPPATVVNAGITSEMGTVTIHNM